jgi:RNA polymerase sigma-70 factor (ECF subfamily)
MPNSVCEESTFDSLYTKHATEVRNLIYYKCGSLQQAEDIVQETFLKLWQKCKEVIFEKVVGLIFTIANRLMLDQLRSEKVALKFEKSQLPQADHSDPHFILRTEEFRSQIEEAISALPSAQREAFLLNRIDKLTYKEIAIRLDISETAVEKRMTKALIYMKNMIEELRKFKI